MRRKIASAISRTQQVTNESHTHQTGVLSYHLLHTEGRPWHQKTLCKWLSDNRAMWHDGSDKQDWCQKIVPQLRCLPTASIGQIAGSGFPLIREVM